MGCPDEDQVAAYLQRALPADELEEMERHLDRCPECRGLVAAMVRDVAERGAPLLLGDVQLIAPVARGGMGQIWRARDLCSGGVVAVKRLHGVAPAGWLRERLVRETRAIAALRHARIVRYLDSGFDAEDQPYLVLEWLEGEDLAQRQRREPLTLDLVIELIRQSLDGLEACHGQGIVHRDIKPGNLFLVDGDDLRVKIVDFGLASLGDTTRVTRAGEILGTLSYLSPEQAQGAVAVDGRSDLYSLGVVLYELLTGVLPFHADRSVAILIKILTETPPRPRHLRPELPDWLEQVTLRAMERDPARRFASAAEMRAALDGGARTAGVSVAPETPPPGSTALRERRLVSLLSMEGPPGEHAERARRAMEAAGALVYRLLGGQQLGIFGLEQTQGNEAICAVEVGLRLRDALGDRARLRVATVHLEVGEGLRLDAGDLDRASESPGELPPGELALDRVTAELVGDQVELGQVGGWQVARGLRSAAPERRLVLGVETPMVGRETELAAIRASFRLAADEGEPRVVLVQGAPGIGKSRLLRESRGELQRASSLCVEARAGASRTRGPYHLLAGPIVELARSGAPEEAPGTALLALVRRFVDDAGDDDETATFLAEAAGLAPAPPGPVLEAARSDPRLMREKTTHALATILTAAGRRGPVTVLIEDLHLASDEAVGTLERLVDALETTPLLLLATTRPELTERRPRLLREANATRLELQPLGRRPLQRLLHAILGATAQGLEDLVLSWSEGNPYHAEELVSWLVAHEVVARGDRGWLARGDLGELELPASLEAAIQGRLDRLDPAQKELLQGAAVFGETFSAAGCEALGLAQAGARLPRLEANECIVPGPGGEWVFRHALLRQVAYQMLPGDRRRWLHLQAACWLEQVHGDDPARVAHHFREGSDHARAADHFARAAERALCDGDLERAVEHFRASLDDPQTTPEARTDRLIGLTRAQILLGRYAEAWGSLDRLPVVPGDGDDRRRAEVQLLRGRVLYGSARYVEAEQALREAADRFAALRDHGRAVEAWNTLFAVTWAGGRYRDAGDIAARLTEEARGSGRGDHLCAAQLTSAYFNVVEGDLSRSIALARDAAGSAHAVGHLHREVDAWITHASALDLVGRYAEAEASLARAAALSARLKTPHHQAGIGCCLGRIALARDRVDEAVGHFVAAAALARRLGDERTLAIALVGEARARARRPGADERLRAVELAERGLALARDKAPPVEAGARLALAEVGLAQRRAAEAVRQARAAVAVMDRLGGQEDDEIAILLAARDALRASGEEDGARDMLRRARATCEARAARIGDPEVRESYLSEVPQNRRALRLWREEGGQA